MLAIIFLLMLGRENIRAQDAAAVADILQGTVVNTATHEAIPRALVYSPDNRFATLTDSQGRFQFVFTSAEQKTDGTTASHGAVATLNRPSMLTARKPGFLVDPNDESQGVQIPPTAKEVTISLVPEALVVGQVTLPSSETPDRITLELYQRQIQDGRARWVPRSSTSSSFSGEFRFADLPAGTYKLFTRELPEAETFTPGQQQYAYPPVYFPNASNFVSAGEIQLSPGKVFQADLSLTRQPYFPVKIPVLNVVPNTSLSVAVSMHGQSGPGYALDYNPQQQLIEGSLPNGIFTIEAFGYGAIPRSGSNTITIHGSPVDGPSMAMVPGRSIAVNVKEEFTSPSQGPSTSVTTFFEGKRSFALRGARAYLNVSLEPTDDFNQNRSSALRNPTSPDDTALAIDGVQTGRYWVRVTSSRGYASSVTSAGIDLLHAPLVVGGAVSPIEITMRDDTAQLEGTIESASSGNGEVSPESRPDQATSSGLHIYCVPIEDSPGQFTQLEASAEGNSFLVSLPPGVYRVLAFKGRRPDIEFRNPEAMRAYDGKGSVVRLVAGQSEHARVPLTSATE